MKLISYNKLHSHYQSKGEYVAEVNAGTHWLEIPDFKR